jgi:hypothetical protein
MEMEAALENEKRDCLLANENDADSRPVGLQRGRSAESARMLLALQILHQLRALLLPLSRVRPMRRQ